MVKIKKYLYLILTILLLIISCASQSSFKKNAAAFEEKGLYEDAVNIYIEELKQNPNNVEAEAGLKLNSQKLLDGKMKKFRTYFGIGEYDKAYWEYTEAGNFINKINRFGILIKISKADEMLFSDVKDNLLALYYKNAKSASDEGNYESAKKSYNKIVLIDPDYRDVSILLKDIEDKSSTQMAENFYQKGISYRNEGKFRKAYISFEKALSYKNDYKDAAEIKEEIFNDAGIRVGIFPVKMNNYNYTVSNALYPQLVTHVVNNSSPFVQVVDREHLEALLKEQKLGFSGIIDERTAAKAGKIIGLNYIIFPYLVEVTESGGEITREQVKAYHIETENSIAGEMIKSSRQTYYYLNRGTKEVTVKLQYKILETSTGRIVNTNIVEDKTVSMLKYATYGGDSNKLSRTKPLLGIFTINKYGIDKSLFAAKRRFPSKNEMTLEAAEKTAIKAAKKIRNYFESIE